MSAVDASITALATLLYHVFVLDWRLDFHRHLPLPFMACNQSYLVGKTMKSLCCPQPF